MPALTAIYSGFVNGDTSASVTTQPNLVTTASSTSTVNGGPYSITASRAVDPNYTISYVNGTMTITPAPLTITADNQNMVYGAAVPALTASYSGFVNEDGAATLTTQPDLVTATSTSDVGLYPINVFGAIDPNYSITYNQGALSITPAPLAITADNQNQTYGFGSLGTIAFSVSPGLVGGQSVDAVMLSTDDDKSTSGNYVVGNGYIIGVSDATGSGGFDADNYNINYVPGTLNVNRRPPIARTNCIRKFGTPTTAGRRADSSAIRSFWRTRRRRGMQALRGPGPI